MYVDGLHSTNFKNDTNTLTFSGHVNLIVSEATKFTPMVIKKEDNTHIFNKTSDKLFAAGATLNLSKSSIPSDFASDNFKGAGDAECFYLVTS